MEWAASVQMTPIWLVQLVCWGGEETSTRTKLEKCACVNINEAQPGQLQGLPPGSEQSLVSNQADGSMNWMQLSQCLRILVDENCSCAGKVPFQPRKPVVYKSSVSSRSREMTLPLYSVFVRPQPECCIHLWVPQHKRDVDLPKRVQRKTTEISERYEVSYEDRVRELGLFSQRLRGDFMVTF